MTPFFLHSVLNLFYNRFITSDVLLKLHIFRSFYEQLKNMQCFNS